MKLIINTNYQSAGTRVLEGMIRRLAAAGHSAVKNDWNNYVRYDIALFMAPDSKILEAKKDNPKIIAGLFDPKLELGWQIEESKAADFLIVSSIEQREAFLKYNKNIFIYYMFPDIAEIKKDHVKKDKIIIGYHGNKQHLDAMKDVSAALDEIAKSHDIELRAIYNMEKLGKWTRNTPKICPVKHIQWSEDRFAMELSQCDIGIAPSVLPAPKLLARPLMSFFYNPEGYNRNDFVPRFKMSNNPGRIYVFSQLNIPVVADFTPSACEMIKDGHSGMLAGTKEGWIRALESLVKDEGLRNELSTNLKTYIDSTLSVDINFKEFTDFLSSLNGSR